MQRKVTFRSASVKRYLLVRWKRRRVIVPASIVMGAIWISRSLSNHDGKVASIIIILICFDALMILSPIHWGGEDR